MSRFLLALLIIAGLYILWDRGAFGNMAGRRTVGADTEGPAEKLGEAVDRGVAKAGKAVERAGESIENAASGH